MEKEKHNKLQWLPFITTVKKALRNENKNCCVFYGGQFWKSTRREVDF